MNSQKFKNSHGRFPVSSDTLDFMQDQIMMAASLAKLVGTGNVIIRDSSSNSDGLVIIGGELMPLKGVRQPFIAIKEEASSIVARGENFENVRIERYAAYTSVNSGGACYPYYYFTQLDALTSIQSTVNRLNETALPIGTIVDWYGQGSLADQLSYGWVPCGYFFVSSNRAAIQEEDNKWKAKYPNQIITTGVEAHGSGAPYYLRIKSVRDHAIPDLTDRFIVQAGNTYQCGYTGGASRVTLTAAQSGLPEHNHSLFIQDGDGGGSGTSAFDQTNTPFGPITLTTTNAGGQDAAESHDNLPPYFALFKIIKVL